MGSQGRAVNEIPKDACLFPIFILLKPEIQTVGGPVSLACRHGEGAAEVGERNVYNRRAGKFGRGDTINKYLSL